jgi:hypothetical protein
MKEKKVINGIIYLPEAKPEGYKDFVITTKKYRKKRAKRIIKNKKK